MQAWTFQDDKQVKKHGADKASWYAGWIDPEGKRRCKIFGPGPRGKALSEKHARKVEGQLLAGSYEDKGRKTWAEFRAEYEERVLAGLAVRTREAARTSLDHFGRIVKPKKVSALMRHKSYQTTQVYINMARQMDGAVASLHVPEVLRAGGAG